MALSIAEFHRPSYVGHAQSFWWIHAEGDWKTNCMNGDKNHLGGNQNSENNSLKLLFCF